VVPVAVVLPTVAFGAIVHAAVVAAWPRGTAGHVQGGGAFGRALDHWVLIPTHVDRIGGLGVLRPDPRRARSVVRGWWCTIALIPTLYLVSFVWENKLIEQVSARRADPAGALLVVIMNVRPAGIFGSHVWRSSDHAAPELRDASRAFGGSRW
jgi:hypothetical protein